MARGTPIHGAGAPSGVLRHMWGHPPLAPLADAVTSRIVRVGAQGHPLLPRNRFRHGPRFNQGPIPGAVVVRQQLALPGLRQHLVETRLGHLPCQQARAVFTEAFELAIENEKEKAGPGL